MEPDGVWAANEQACLELGYDIEYIAQFLQEGEYPQELLDKIVNITGCNDRDKIRIMLDTQKDDVNDSLLLAYKTLVWMEDEDPGGIIFLQRMLTQKAELVVDNMVRELMLSSCEPPLGLDPEHLLQRHRQLLLDDWSQSDSPLCQSFDEHLGRVSEFSSAPAEVGALQKRMKLLIEQRKKEKSEEEARCQQALSRMGRCPMDFEWLKEDGGWRCAGGSHYVSDADVCQLC